MKSIGMRLKDLAGDDPARLKILAARKARSKSRNRTMRCVTCDTYESSSRDASDCCDDCLNMLWGAQSVLDGEYSKAKGSGMMPVKMAMTIHALPYLGIDYESSAMPGDAVFSIRRHGGNENSPNSVVQHWFWHLFEGLSKALPCDPESQKNAVSLIKGDWSDNLYARLPASTVEAINALWHYIGWQAEESYRLGFEKGRNMLSDMNLGKKTFEGFTEDVANQTRRLSEQKAKHAAGKS